VMSDLANSRRTNALAYLVIAIIIGLNVLLIFQMFGVKFG